MAIRMKSKSLLFTDAGLRIEPGIEYPFATQAAMKTALTASGGSLNGVTVTSAVVDSLGIEVSESDVVTDILD